MARRLGDNPYTIHQSADFMKVAPLLKIYRLVESTIEIDQIAAAEYAERARLQNAEWAIDELSVWNRALTSEEIQESYSKYFATVATNQSLDESRSFSALYVRRPGGDNGTTSIIRFR